MKSFPTNNVLNDPTKRSIIDRMFSDIIMDLESYMLTFSNSIIKNKQLLTITCKQILMLPEHKPLYENLKQKYPELNLNRRYFIKIAFMI